MTTIGQYRVSKQDQTTVERYRGLDRKLNRLKYQRLRLMEASLENPTRLEIEREISLITTKIRGIKQAKSDLIMIIGQRRLDELASWLPK